MPTAPQPLSLSLFNHQTGRHWETLSRDRVLDRARSLSRLAREQGLGSLRVADDPLIPIAMELDERGRLTKNSLGVLDLAWQVAQHPEWPARIQAEVDAIRAGIQAAHGVKLENLIWAGMGGSAEDKVMYQQMGLLEGGVRVWILDSTDPAKLQAILAAITRRDPLPRALRKTLVLGMAMGMTSYEPVVNLEKLDLLFRRNKVPSQSNFLYMTLPGSLLDRFAGPRGYRRVGLQPDGDNTTAGRHSGPLTRGSLYPLALNGVNLDAWMAATVLSGDEMEQALRMSAFLHGNGLEGRDKITLLLPAEWTGAGVWTKQDFEESLGKSEELGIKVFPAHLAPPGAGLPASLLARTAPPEDCLPASLLARTAPPEARLRASHPTRTAPSADLPASHLARTASPGAELPASHLAHTAPPEASLPPGSPSQDRVFWAVQVPGCDNPDRALLRQLKQQGYPVAVLDLRGPMALPRYMQWVHTVVFGLGCLRQMNFVTQPSVELYKQIAARLHAQARRAGSISRTRPWRGLARTPYRAAAPGRITLHYDSLVRARLMAPQDLGPARLGAAEILARAAGRLHQQRKIEYAEMTFYGDMRYRPEGQRLRRLLDAVANNVFAARLRISTDVYEGPAMNHSYHEMIIGHGRCFSIVLATRKQARLRSLDYRADYHQAQWLATKLALERRGRAVVAVTFPDLSRPSLRALQAFFRDFGRRLKALGC